MPRTRLVVSLDAAGRLDAATAWLAAQPADAEVLVVAPTWEAADEVARAAVPAAGARFGLVRTTVDRLASRLAAPALAQGRLVPAGGLSLGAVTARAVHRLLAGKKLRHFAPVAGRPGFPTAATRTLEELRMNGVGSAALRGLAPGGRDLATLAQAIERELADAGLADRAALFAAALAAVGAAPAPPPVGLALLLLDLPVLTAREVDLVAAIARKAPAVFATASVSDGPTVDRLARALGVAAETFDAPAQGSLAAVQAHLFEDTAPPAASLDDSVTLTSSPGEARECVEIARRLQAEAARGVPFDRMAIFLHSPKDYVAHLEEALGRADIPAFFARGTKRPHAAGRALLALLACAAEKLSARRFAEYLSLAQVPDPGASAAADWTPPGDDLLSAPTEPERDDQDVVLPHDPDSAAAVGGTLRAPWRWERLLVDAAVIGGVDRWQKRLQGLANEIEKRRDALEDDDEANIERLTRLRADLGHLRAYALPLIERLASLPGSESWGTWLTALRELATAALRDPAPVLATLAELEPMAPIGPVDLDEVRQVLGPRLRDLTDPPPRRRYGCVFVAPTTSSRGLAFDVVFVPGLAEKLFPRKIVEDPILPDAAREALSSASLVTQRERVAAERLALRLAAGAARTRLHLSYPRLDVEQARPRVPSFYALEALRAAEGTLPGFEALATRAEGESGARLGWPAPEQPTDAIDEAEYDLALLAPLMGSDDAAAAGSAAYLLNANPYLARALRARARRWLKRWTVADGLVEPDDLARAALARHQMTERAFSPTALQHYAACPYRFFLQAIHRLQPREEPEAIEVLDPLTRGSLVHDIQFEVLTRLRAAKLLPVRPQTLEQALGILERAAAEIAQGFEERLAPAIPRVWQDALAGIRADLREWLRRQARDEEGWVPHKFELSFGITDRDRAHEDPDSVSEPVALDIGIKLRGSIDLVERNAGGVLRVTDYKTGKSTRTKQGLVVGGGEVLQPVLYALACETLLKAPVEGGRLYYCTSDGGFVDRRVELEPSRAAAAEVVSIVAGALKEGFLPAAPRAQACRWCDYRPVCGPWEEQRTRGKPQDKVRDLKRLRELP